MRSAWSENDSIRYDNKAIFDLGVTCVLLNYVARSGSFKSKIIMLHDPFQLRICSRRHASHAKVHLFSNVDVDAQQFRAGDEKRQQINVSWIFHTQPNRSHAFDIDKQFFLIENDFRRVAFYVSFASLFFFLSPKEHLFFVNDVRHNFILDCFCVHLFSSSSLKIKTYYINFNQSAKWSKCPKWSKVCEIIYCFNWRDRACALSSLFAYSFSWPFHKCPLMNRSNFTFCTQNKSTRRK